MLIDVCLCIIILALICAIIFLILRHEAERKDLYNRIMAGGDVDEYNIIKGDSRPPKIIRPITNRRNQYKAGLKEKYTEGQE